MDMPVHATLSDLSIKSYPAGLVYTLAQLLILKKQIIALSCVLESEPSVFYAS